MRFLTDKQKAQSKLGTVNLKPTKLTSCLLLSNAVTMTLHIEMTMQAYQDDHYSVHIFVVVRAVMSPILF